MKTKQLLIAAIAAVSLVGSAVSQNLPNYVPTNGLVGWWPFNGNATDESINTNDGTVNGATLTTDRFGNANSAYSFDGVNNYIDLLNINFNSDFSVSLWFYAYTLKSFTSDNIGQKIISKFTNSSTFPNGWEVELNLNGNVGIGNAAVGGINQNSSTINSWHSVNFIYSSINQTMTLYQNGNPVDTIVGFIVNSNTAPIRLGARANSSDNICFYFDGKLDDIGIWNRALTQQEISNLYNANICYDHVTVTDTLVINTNITGFNPVTYQNTIKVFPNPSNDHITIHYGNYANLSGYQLKITNSLGQQMFQTSITQQSSFVDLKTWTGNGIYFVHIIDAQGNTIDIKKIVLQ